MEKQEAVKFFSDFYFGEHHFPNELKECGYGYSMVCQPSRELSTFDFNHLTRLVVMAHDRCIRVEIVPNGKSLRICIHKRERSNDAVSDMMSTHPTLEYHIASIRKREPFEIVK